MLNILRNRMSSSLIDSELSLEELVEDNLSDDNDKTQKIKEKRSNTSFQPRTSQRKRQHSQISTSTLLKKELENKTLKKKKKEGDEICTICEQFGSDNDVWWRCRSCASWAHADCTSAENLPVEITRFFPISKNVPFNKNICLKNQ